MPRLPLVLLTLFALFGAAPSAHGGAKQAWDVQAVEGSYSIDMTADDLLECGDVSPDDGDFDQLARARYEARFTGRKLAGRGPYLKYFPYLGGPASPGPVGIPLTVETKSDETKRVMNQGDGCRVEPETSCQGSRTLKTRPRAWALGAITRGKRVRVGLPIIGATSVLPACDGDYYDALHPDWPGDSITPFIAERVSLSSFRRRSVVVRFTGSRRVRKKAGQFNSASGTMTWSATLKLRKVVIPEDCRERAGGSPFVCRL